MHRCCIMQYAIIWSQIPYINILVDWSLSGIMTSKLVIRESESPLPAPSSILISRMKSPSINILYRSRRGWYDSIMDSHHKGPGFVTQVV